MADSESPPASSSENTEGSATPGSDAAKSASETTPAAPVDDGNGKSAAVPHQHHVSNILDEFLEEPEPDPKRRFKHPMLLDVALGIGLLIALGGFTIGLFKIYLSHSAEQNITQHNYRAAIAILRGAPFPGFFTIPGSDPEEMLYQALYLDALDRMEVDNDVDGALKELQSIRPGSHYFSLAQEIIQENFVPASTSLQGGASVTEQAAPAEQSKPLLPELPRDASP